MSKAFKYKQERCLGCGAISVTLYCEQCLPPSRAAEGYNEDERMEGFQTMGPNGGKDPMDSKGKRKKETRRKRPDF